MGVRLLAVAFALALLAGGCGGGPSRSDAVAKYIDQVNVMTAGLAPPARTVSEATRELAKPHADTAAAERKLRRAARRIEVLRRRLATVSAPPEAVRLRSLMLELLGQEGQLAGEVAGYAAFAPAYAEALRPLAPAGSRLQRTLSAKRSATAVAAALDAYARTATAAVRRLRALHPPPVAAPVRATEVRTLEHVRTAATSVARALRAKRVAEVPALVHGLEVAAAGDQTVAAQRARIAAVQAYNRQVRSLDSLTKKIYRERNRLQAAVT